MYLKKIDGPRAVRLPDGTMMTRADLPPAETERWVASRKLAVVRGVRFGLITEAQAIELYGLSEEELAEWMSAAKTFGKNGLKATHVQSRRQL
ncbi:Protein of unknown function [Roseivivax halotolerans]|jgi:hypothetical protein|uniref:DUF1153 domain-containing protein n=1 Tax=Roseivivax halotolerans TaxID=93684 RepID=A0A1I5YB47_9RHOB|nr:DUF1153 domain-containing protein [Roseivivax halotolerans]SFQ41399.1 Protein of unknown function [Roseivivax halotolerans]